MPVSGSTIFDEIAAHDRLVAFFVPEPAQSFSLSHEGTFPPGVRFVAVGPSQSLDVETAPWAPERRPFACAFFGDSSVACLRDLSDPGEVGAFLDVVADAMALQGRGGGRGPPGSPGSA